MISISGVPLLLIVGLLAYVLYLTFGSDAITNFRGKFSESRAARDKVAKIAQIKLVSDDRKEIEKFVSDNASYLSDATVKLLVARIEAIRDDRIIADDNLRVRFEELDKSTNPEPQYEEPRVVSGRGMKRA